MSNKKMYLVGATLCCMMALGNSLVSADISQTKPGVDIQKFKQDLVSVSQVASPSISAAASGVKTLSTKYKLLPGDTLAFSIYGEPEFNQAQLLVRPDGYITIEPFGDIKVSGASIDEVTTNLKTKFSEYFLDPKLSVKIVNLSAAKIYVYGAVNKPGLFEQQRNFNNSEGNGNTPDLTVANALSNAGGIKSNADLEHIVIKNNETGESQEINLLALIKNGDASQDLVLRSGDSVYVPQSTTNAQLSDDDFLLLSSSSLAPPTFPVRVIGAVSRPGLISLSPSNPSVNSAIASSEGFALYANKTAIKVQRMTPTGEMTTLLVNPEKNDIVLRPNDLVYVPDKNTSALARKFAFVTDVFLPFASFAGAFNGWADMFDPSRRYRYR